MFFKRFCTCLLYLVVLSSLPSPISHSFIISWFSSFSQWFLLILIMKISMDLFFVILIYILYTYFFAPGNNLRKFRLRNFRYTNDIASSSIRCRQVMSSSNRCRQVMSSSNRCRQVMSSSNTCRQVMSSSNRCRQVMSSSSRCRQVMSSSNRCRPVIGVVK